MNLYSIIVHLRNGDTERHFIRALNANEARDRVMHHWNVVGAGPAHAEKVNVR